MSCDRTLLETLEQVWAASRTNVILADLFALGGGVEVEQSAAGLRRPPS